MPQPIMPPTQSPLHACHRCGLIQSLPPRKCGFDIICAHCHGKIKHASQNRNRVTALLASSALAFYVPAITLPILQIEKFGHVSQDSLVTGIISLWQSGHWLIGAIVLLFSVVLPPLKLIALWWLCGKAHSNRKRVFLYRLVEFLGRWSMLDVLLVAVLVAFIKIGDFVSVSADRGLLAFAVMVLLSLLASAAFNPLLIWQNNALKRDD